MSFRSTLAVLVLCLVGCGGPPPPPPTVVNVAVSTGAEANGGAPVGLRIYQLASPAGFEGAQFFQLFNGDAAVLKDDLVKRDDLLLAPGTAKAMVLMPAEKVKAIGVFAGLAGYEKAAWHAVVAVPANKTSTLAVTVGADGVAAKIEPAKP